MAASTRLNHRALPMTAWPRSDQEAWAAAIRHPVFLVEGGRGAAWRPESGKSAQGTYGRWLAWLMAQGVDLETEAPAERLTIDRLRAYVAFLQDGRSSVTVASYTGVLCMAVLAMFPDRNWTKLQIAQARLKSRSSPTRIKRLETADQLLQLGFDLIARSAAILDQPFDPKTDRIRRIGAARDFRDGLIVGLLAARPLRVKNLLGIEIGIHLHTHGAHVTLHFEAKETKAHRVYDAVWPEVLVPALARYQAEIRPMLIEAVPRGQTARPARPPGAFLWMAQGGTPLTTGALRKAIARHTLLRFGHAMNPHLFRDCVATTASNEDPNHMQQAAQLLGHTKLRTTERSYIAANSTAALGDFSRMIAAMRKTNRCRIGRSAGRPAMAGSD